MVFNMLSPSMRKQKVGFLSNKVLSFSLTIISLLLYYNIDPGSHDESTFYVTNIREPVSRSVSGFKCESRLHHFMLRTSSVMLTNILFL
jgi:hypothetical protein